MSEDFALCERSCEDVYYPTPINCSHSSEGCVCQEGLYRNTDGLCVIPALCPCHDQGVVREVNTHARVSRLTPDADPWPSSYLCARLIVADL